MTQTWGKLTSRLVAMEHIYNGSKSVLATPFLHFALLSVQSHFESIMMWLYANYAHRHLNAFLPTDPTYVCVIDFLPISASRVVD